MSRDMLMLEPWFDRIQLAVLGCWAVLGLGRAFRFWVRGSKVVALDRERTLPQALVDTGLAVCLVIWSYETVAAVWPWLRPGFWPQWLHRVLFQDVIASVAGCGVMAGGLALYGVALHDLGASWRLGIDRKSSGPLITRGIYGWSQHPIYVGFDLIFVGAFLNQGTVIFLLLVVTFVPLLHCMMVREERFLEQHYGEAYETYRSRVRRYI